MRFQEQDADIRFWAKVEKTETCWIWHGGKASTPRVYGTFWFKGRLRPAHRWIYERTIGPISKELVIDHLCNNGSCVRVDHLRACTQKENNERTQSPSAIHARKTHCLRGHPFSKENTIIFGKNKNWRKCKTCRELRKEKLRLSKPKELS